MTADETIELDGLAGEATILVDAHGVPHIRAQSESDLFFTQGFNAARDRLWQMDLWRKRGLGLLAADFGPGFLAQDYACRLVLYRGDMAAEWAAYAPDAQSICERFVAGINAYVDLCAREADRLPPEFVAMQTRPARWAAEDVVRIRSHGLTRNAVSEILRANVIARADAATDLARKNLEPAHAPRAELDLSTIPLAAADLARLATAEASFSPARLAAGEDEIWDWTGVDDLGAVVRRRDAKAPVALDLAGSNNWAISGARTASGRPILGSDPHRTHSVPPLRYLAHLTAPGLDVVGAGEPYLPGLAFGHNDRVAFSLTIFYPDQEDVYVCQTAPDDPRAVLYEGRVEPMRVLAETFEVKGGAPRHFDLLFTRQGPVIFEDRAARRVYALRSVWFEPGTCPYARSLSTMRATSLADFADRVRGWGAPSANHVAADVDGHIGWLPRGLTPKRPNHDGLTPVPGDGRYEWAGFFDDDELPRLIDPPDGFVASANEMNLSPDFLARGETFGFEWTERSRSTRIREVLAAQNSHSLSDTTALQTDATSVAARRLVRLALAIPATPAPARALFVGWDARLSADSAAAALCEVWWAKHLKPALLARLAPDPALRALLAPGDVEALLRALESPDRRFGPAPEAARDALLAETLAAALADCAARLGGDPSGWAWGRLHHGAFDHPLSGLPGIGARFDVAPLPLGGSGSSPMHTGYRPSDFRAVAGASVRLALDLGDWDASLCVNAPGQSGDPRSPHYADLAPIWARGAYVPLPFSAAAVEAAAVRRIRLVPSATAAPDSDRSSRLV
ncbi:MAG: penicillin acylase family protein [Methylobacteriaceae bacterium]|nr:penicillin acylase family protein [Methylobacteriaceae bacterium]